MSHQIQFKKLVWEEACKKGWWECQTPFAMMNIFFHEEDMGTYYFVLRIGKDQKFKLDSIEACKENAQLWFEEQLTQFIETSENPAKKKKQPKIDSLISAREKLVNRIAEIEIQIRDLKNPAQ